MTPSASLFLDAARFIAAMVVFLSHLTNVSINAVFPWVRWGHEAVVVFFVISGYVIAYVTATRERVFADYAAARLGRLYSVVAPALALTLVLDGVGMSVAPALYSLPDHQQSLVRLLANLLFMQESWNFTITALSNRAFWSLAFEFWYYVIFAAFFFAKGRARVVLVGLSMLAAGPRIVAYFPLWLLGLATYHISARWAPSPDIKWPARMLCAATIMAMLWMGSPLAYMKDAMDAAYPDRMLHLGGLAIFIGDLPRLPADLLLGVVFSAMLYFAQGELANAQAFAARAIRYLAGATFTLYLFHLPLVYFFIAVCHFSKDSLSDIVVTGVLVVASCMAFSHLFERRVADYRRVFHNVFQLVGRRTTQAAG